MCLRGVGGGVEGDCPCVPNVGGLGFPYFRSNQIYHILEVFDGVYNGSLGVIKSLE